MRSNISISAGTIELKIELPWEVAELLVKHGPQTLRQIANALEEDRKQNQQRQRTLELKSDDTSVRKKRWADLARQVDRELRRTRATTRDATRTIRRYADEFGLSAGSLRAILNEYRRNRTGLFRARRDAQVVRLHLLGVSNRKIASQIRPRITPQSVGRILAQYPDLLKALRDFDTQRLTRKSPENCGPESRREGSEFSPGSPEEAAESYKEQLLERQELHRQLGISFYRTYRRAAPSKSDRKAVFARLAEPTDFNAVYAEALVSDRRRRVQAYIRQRRLQTVARLVGEHQTNQKIAETLSVSVPTVARFVRELKLRKRLFSGGA